MKAKIIKKIIRIGDSCGIILDKVFLDSNDIQKGDLIKIEITKVELNKNRQNPFENRKTSNRYGKGKGRYLFGKSHKAKTRG